MNPNIEMYFDLDLDHLSKEMDAQQFAQFVRELEEVSQMVYDIPALNAVRQGMLFGQKWSAHLDRFGDALPL